MSESLKKLKDTKRRQTIKFKIVKSKKEDLERIVTSHVRNGGKIDSTTTKY